MITTRALRAPLLAIAALLATACAAGEGEPLDIADETTEVGVRGHFELWKADDGQYYFHLLAGNGELLLWSEGYRNRTGALGGILSVLDNGGLESRYEIAAGEAGPYLRLRAANGEVIAVSESYASRSNASRAIQACTRNIAGYLEHWSRTSGARFEVFESEASGRFYFRLYAKNGAQVLRSQSYAAEASALNGAFAVAEYGLDPDAYDLRQSASGGFYFNLRAPNNQVIATSEVYATRASAVRGRDALIALLPTIELL